MRNFQKISLVLFLSVFVSPTSGFPQVEGFNYGVLPAKPFTVVFRNVLRHDLFHLVEQSLRGSQLVKPFVMRRAQRGYIEYEGMYAGEQNQLIGMLQNSVAGSLHIDSRYVDGEGLEIVVTAYEGAYGALTPSSPLPEEPSESSVKSEPPTSRAAHPLPEIEVTPVDVPADMYY